MAGLFLSQLFSIYFIKATLKVATVFKAFDFLGICPGTYCPTKNFDMASYQSYSFTWFYFLRNRSMGFLFYKEAFP